MGTAKSGNHTPGHMLEISRVSAQKRRVTKIEGLIKTSPLLESDQVEHLVQLLRAIQR